MPTLFGESFDSGTPALTLVNRGMLGPIGHLIYGYNAANQFAFSVSQSGEIVTAAGIFTEHSIVVRQGDIFVRGVKLTSDKKAKENFSTVNKLEILDKLSSLPIQSWSYIDDTSDECHIGPTAQDFHAAFGLNREDETRISSTDLHGVALAAIQGLNEKLRAENDELHKKLANLEARLSALEFKD
ncbi:tail fiber domain-containing protein [Bacillus thuringiensis]|nr:tail fiber domain-containing protein [Bacillus thuringiensis]MRB61180.1 hypothetical protein [Bacillus thuringiensis]